MVRQGLRTLVDWAAMRVMGEASNGQEALRLAHAWQPAVAVLTRPPSSAMPSDTG
jgi:YesN/AraC family two-component response regulator